MLIKDKFYDNSDYKHALIEKHFDKIYNKYGKLSLSKVITQVIKLRNAYNEDCSTIMFGMRVCPPENLYKRGLNKVAQNNGFPGYDVLYSLIRNRTNSKWAYLNLP